MGDRYIWRPYHLSYLTLTSLFIDGLVYNTNYNKLLLSPSNHPWRLIAERMDSAYMLSAQLNESVLVIFDRPVTLHLSSGGWNGPYRFWQALCLPLLLLALLDKFLYYLRFWRCTTITFAPNLTKMTFFNRRDPFQTKSKIWSWHYIADLKTNHSSIW